ncbi:MAG: methyltransferase domain-containing protein [Acidobacteria bacterium]|nr:methyltransferase domain-containing protein [Acidobacteriota bacterium]
MRRLGILASGLAAVLFCGLGWADELPPPLESYMGRAIAQTMSWHGAPWLIRETREQEEAPSKLLEALDLRPGQTVADIGCGNGFYSLQIAQRVGPTGKVYAVDIQPEMLELLQQRAAEAGVTNIVPVLSTPADPKLPEGAVDLILLVDVYHELAYPEQMLAGMRRGLSPDGRIALAEYREEDLSVPIKPLHKMSKAQMRKEYESNGLRLVGQFDQLPWQHLMFFARAR